MCKIHYCARCMVDIKPTPCPRCKELETAVRKLREQLIRAESYALHKEGCYNDTPMCHCGLGKVEAETRSVLKATAKFVGEEE